MKPSTSPSGPRMSRSDLMSRIRGKNTHPERTLRSLLWKAGLRYRLHLRIGKTTPDLVFPKHKLVVFVDGCFWHGCPKHYGCAHTNESFWDHKLIENNERDRVQTLQLEQSGWQVIRIWQHEILLEPDLIADAVLSIIALEGPCVIPQMRVIKVDVLDRTLGLECHTLAELRNPSATGVKTGTRKAFAAESYQELTSWIKSQSPPPGRRGLRRPSRS
jgi:DNA mismatch endonuclease (patch repair protein)